MFNIISKPFGLDAKPNNGDRITLDTEKGSDKHGQGNATNPAHDAAWFGRTHQAQGLHPNTEEKRQADQQHRPASKQEQHHDPRADRPSLRWHPIACCVRPRAGASYTPVTLSIHRAFPPVDMSVAAAAAAKRSASSRRARAAGFAVGRVFLGFTCPSSSWVVSSRAPASWRCVAEVCLNQCGLVRTSSSAICGSSQAFAAALHKVDTILRNMRSEIATRGPFVLRTCGISGI